VSCEVGETDGLPRPNALPRTTWRTAGAAKALDPLSLRRLARALDVTPMAVYRHVRNKSHLLDLMADRLLERIDLAAGEPAAWNGRLRRLLGSYEAAAAENAAAALLLVRPFSSPAALRISETLLEILHAAGFETAQAVRLFQLIIGMLLGPAIRRAFWAEAARRRPTDAARQEASIEGGWGAEFGYLSSAAERFLDWSPAPDADRLAIDLLIFGLQAVGH